jgi:hypothetical protein
LAARRAIGRTHSRCDHAGVATPRTARLSRPARISIVLAIVIVFLAISFVLARVLGASGAERSAVTHLIQAEARGDAAQVVHRIDGCADSRPCRTSAGANARRLRRTGEVQVLAYSPSTGFGIANTRGRARIAWRVAGKAPVVQCVDVRRAGNPITGLRVELLGLSAPIRSDAPCH